MSWTTTMRWTPLKAQPHKQGNTSIPSVDQAEAHIARDLADEPEKGKHSNPQINTTRTRNNVTMVNGGNGKMIPATSKKQISDYRKKRLAELQNYRTLKDGRKVKVAHRKDATLVSEIVLQLDPKFTGEIKDMTPEKKAEVERLLQVMIDTEIERVGIKNVIAYSVHWDETHPHVQMHITPGTEDGRLSYTRFYGAGSFLASRDKYKAIHNNMREALQREGYDATMERVSVGKGHLGIEGYKEWKDEERSAEKTREKADIWLKNLEDFEAELDDREFDLDQRQKEQSTAEAEIAYERRYQTTRARELDQRDRDQDDREAHLDGITKKQQQRQKRLDNLELQLRQQREDQNERDQDLDNAEEEIKDRKTRLRQIENEYLKATQIAREKAQYEDPDLVRYAKGAKDKDGISMYDRFQSAQKKKTDREKREDYKLRAQAQAIIDEGKKPMSNVERAKKRRGEMEARESDGLSR